MYVCVCASCAVCGRSVCMSVCLCLLSAQAIAVLALRSAGVRFDLLLFSACCFSAWNATAESPTFFFFLNNSPNLPNLPETWCAGNLDYNTEQISNNANLLNRLVIVATCTFVVLTEFHQISSKLYPNFRSRASVLAFGPSFCSTSTEACPAQLSSTRAFILLVLLFLFSCCVFPQISKHVLEFFQVLNSEI